MKNTLFLLLVLFSTYLYSQTKKPTTIKPAKPEIDKLYEKYKDSENITLYTPLGELYGNIFIELNENKKPVSVTIHGGSKIKQVIAEFISTTIKMKLKQGYKATKVPFGWEAGNYAEIVEQGLVWGFKEDKSFQLLMTKGSMYFRADAGCLAQIEEDSIVVIYTWEIETGDTKRRGGKNTTNFEF